MKCPRSLGWLRCGAGFLAGPIVAWSVIAADTPPPTTPLGGLVKKFTEKRTAQAAPLPASQPVAPKGAEKIFEQCKFNHWGEQHRKTLERCQHYGLRLEIAYEPNFVLDAWKIDRVELEVDFGFWEWWHYRGDPESGSRSQSYMVSKPAPAFPRVITFSRSSLLNDGNRKLTLITDGFFFPK